MKILIQLSGGRGPGVALHPKMGVKGNSRITRTGLLATLDLFKCLKAVRGNVNPSLRSKADRLCVRVQFSTYRKLRVRYLRSSHHIRSIARMTISKSHLLSTSERRRKSRPCQSYCRVLLFDAGCFRFSPHHFDAAIRIDRGVAFIGLSNPSSKLPKELPLINRFPS